jgi:hypothetical protein
LDSLCRLASLNIKLHKGIYEKSYNPIAEQLSNYAEKLIQFIVP